MRAGFAAAVAAVVATGCAALGYQTDDAGRFMHSEDGGRHVFVWQIKGWEPTVELHGLFLERAAAVCPTGFEVESFEKKSGTSHDPMLAGGTYIAVPTTRYHAVGVATCGAVDAPEPEYR
jgi:hypothetical protein